jgi:hypothetical protein
VLVGAGTGVALGASAAEVGGVGGASVAGGPGEAVPARATGLGDGVPSTLMFTACCRLNRKNPIATRTTISPSMSASHGQRFDGSPGWAGAL